MRRKIYFILLVAAILILLNAGVSFSQEGTTPEQAQLASEPEVQWLWGELISVDTPNKTVLVKYLDYETETEKEISITVDDKTTYENVKSIDEIKPQDTVSIDYIVNSEGKNLAKNISLEKPESQEPETKPTPQEEIKPEDITPEKTTEEQPQTESQTLPGPE